MLVLKYDFDMLMNFLNQVLIPPFTHSGGGCILKRLINKRRHLLLIVLFLYAYNTAAFASSEHYTLFQNRDHNQRVIEFMITQHGTSIASGTVWPGRNTMVRYVADGKTTPLQLYFRYRGREEWANSSRLGISRADSEEEARKNPYQINHTDL